jgi:hypothetical protein
MPVHEQVTAILPFKILERIVGKPLRIRGIVMTAGMSRNFNIYTLKNCKPSPRSLFPRQFTSSMLPFQMPLEK